jgi:protoporphyrinogen/coproporphyrinogen III oxidase
MARLVIVGGGIAGLVVAYRAARAGDEVLVVEAGEQAGGQVAHHRVAGLTLDAGAEAYAVRGDAIPALLTELDLAEHVVAPASHPAWLHGADNRAHPLPAASMLGIPGRPLARDVAAVVGWPAAARAALDPLMPAFVGASASTVGDLVRRRMGAGVLDRLVAPVVEGVHSRHPDEVLVAALGEVPRHIADGASLGAAVRRVRQSAPAGSLVASLAGGLHTLVAALVAAIGEAGGEVRTGVRAELIDATSIAVTDASGVVAREQGRVVLAAPGVAGPVDTTPAHLITLALEAPELAAAPRGTGLLVARGASVRARALTHATAKWPWLRERAGTTEIVRLSYAEPVAVATALADTSVLLGVRLEPRQVLDHASVVWHRAHRTHPHPTIPTVGEQVSGTGLAAVITHAERIAEELIA